LSLSVEGYKACDPSLELIIGHGVLGIIADFAAWHNIIRLVTSTVVHAVQSV
jgi:hypothetical protein